jgi:YD repeat-containing protein
MKTAGTICLSIMCRQAEPSLLAYSPTGNRLTQTDPVTGDVTTFTYDNGNRLLAGVDVSGTTTYTYDNNGNQLTIEEPSGDITTNTWTEKTG